jgi:hypothetical protein
MQSPIKTAALIGMLLTSACVPSTPEQQAGALTLPTIPSASRQVQARRFDTRDEAGLMAAVLGVLQDLGYTVNETSTGVGLVVGSKDRRGTRVRISVAVRPTNDRTATIARVSIQTLAAPAFGQQLQVQTISDAGIYQQLFERLSKSLFLEAHEI